MKNGLFLGLMTVTLSAIALLQGVGTVPFASPDATPRTAFVHLFEWRWDDIAQECEAVLGPNGYDAVQISPPNEHVVVAERGYPWWQRYQPVSYRLESRSGDRAQLVNMIRRCHAAGVKVYADAVINHMAGIESGTGSAGTPFTKYHYPGLYDANDFHTCRQGIRSYQDRYDVTHCELVGLADLDTRSARVQRRLVQYLTSLLDLGIDGFRIDAAKHIAASDLATILTQVRAAAEPDPYIYQEVIDPGYEAIRKMEYYGNGDVHEFEYGRLVGEIFLGEEGKTLSQLQTLGEDWGLMPSDKAVVFIDNHDKQRGHGGGGTYLTYKHGPLYTLANVFMLAHPYGYPQVMSSYDFSDSDQGPPATADGQTKAVFVNGQATCGQDWVCEHRRGAIAAMVGFRNATDGAPLTHWWSNGHDQIAFGRADKGFVVINRESAPLTHTFETGLPAGTYCNVVAQGPPTQSAEADCAPDHQLQVDRQGRLTVALPAMEAAAIHIRARLR